MKERRHDIDWLRVLAMMAVFLFHCSRFYDASDWHVKSPDQIEALDFIRGGLVSIWLMEIFFLLSGVGTWYALRSRTAGQYVVNRIKRLLIPLYSVGLLLLIPSQAYMDRVTHGRLDESFWNWLPTFYRGLPRDLVHVSGLQDPQFVLPYSFAGHLWFVRFLFIISLVTLPLLLHLRSDVGSRRVERLAGWFDRRGGAFLPVIPLATVLICLRFVFPGDRTWADFLWYTIYFVVGFVIASDERFTRSIRRHGWAALALWLACSGLSVWVVEAFAYDPVSRAEPFSAVYVLWQLIYSVASWSAIVLLLGLAARYLNFNHKWLSYCNEAVLPFYLLHQPIILLVGWFVIPWSVGILPGFLVIATVSFITIMLVYDLFIRRFNPVRFLFGMRPKKQVNRT